MTIEYASFLNQYEKSGLKKKYAEYYKILDTLDLIAEAYNYIYKQDYEEALKDFATLNFLPMRKGDDPSEKAKLYINLD